MKPDDLIRTLQMRGGFELVNQQASANQLRLLGRVSRQASNGWLLVLRQLLRAADRSPWSIDISKQYFLREDKVMYGWRVIVQAEGVAQHYADVIKVIATTPRPRAIVDEQPLPGVRGDRNAPSVSNRGKGAQGSLSAVVGPMAVAAMQRR
jgi:hypothetical protein